MNGEKVENGEREVRAASRRTEERRSLLLLPPHPCTPLFFTRQVRERSPAPRPRVWLERQGRRGPGARARSSLLRFSALYLQLPQVVLPLPLQEVHFLQQLLLMELELAHGVKRHVCVCVCVCVCCVWERRVRRQRRRKATAAAEKANAGVEKRRRCFATVRTGPVRAQGSREEGAWAA